MRQGKIELVGSDDLRIELLAHAVQPLKLVTAAGAAGQLHDGRNSLCIVGRKLRIDGIACREQFTRAQATYDTSVFTLRVNTG